jgi:TonB family protein
MGGFFLVRMLISDDGEKRKRQVRMITLMKPPPPPPIKEKPPEPKEKKEIIEPEKKDEPEQTDDQSKDDTPPGEQLGVDAEGSAGTDGFGLAAKKGGRPLIGGGLGENSLLRQFAWYTQILQEEIRKKVNQELEKNGGIPKGDLKTYVKVVLDANGRVVNFEIYGSSGNPKMDEAVRTALKVARISEPPPDGMPKAMKIKIASQG